MEVKKQYRFANNTVLRLSPEFILPEEQRPCLSEVSDANVVPIVDLKGYDECQNGLVQTVSDACRRVGMFQVINHGVPPELCHGVSVAISNFFQLPAEERAIYETKDHSRRVKIFNYYLKSDDQTKVTMWSETFSHPWHPSGDFTHHLPTKPLQYRDVFSAYAREIGSVMNRVLSFDVERTGPRGEWLGENPNFYSQANYYPPCPQPDLTMGLNEHSDITGLTILQQFDGVPGLQVKYDQNWVAVDPLPGAFVIILADQIQVLSNGRYKSPVHRAVTNKMLPRLSLAMFYAPNDETLIGPMEELTDEEHPPIYRNYRYKEYMQEFYRQQGKKKRLKEAFMLQCQP